MEELGAILESGSVAAVELAASALAERGTPAKDCPNCGKPMIGPFCAICGQPDNTHRRSLKHLLHDFIKDIISFDSRILRTTRALLLKPGELPMAFRHGRTQPYVPPVRLYLFVSLLFFLFLSATGLAFVQLGLRADSAVFTHDKAGNVYKTSNGKRVLLDSLRSDAAGHIFVKASAGVGIAVPNLKADGKTVTNTVTTRWVFFDRPGDKDVRVTPEARAALDKVNKEMMKDTADAGWFMRGVYQTIGRLETDPAALNGPLTAWIPRILFVLLPLYALLLAAFYRKQRADYLFVDHLVFSLTMHTFAFVVLIGAAVLAQVMAGGWVALFAWLVLSVYFLVSLKRFYGQNWVRTGLKFAGISFIYPVFFLGPALFFALAASVVSGG